MSNGPEEPRSELRRKLGVAFLVAWMPLVAFGVGSLMVGHLAPLPAPVVDAASAGEALGIARERRSALAVVHVLDVHCGCSQRIAAHLLTSERPTDTHEVVVLVGTDAELAEALDARGFVVESETPETAAARFGEFAAPALAVLAAADGDALYVGGYTDRKQGPAVQDLATIEACRSGARPNPLPVYGCGATKELEAALDPLRLRR